MRRRLHSQDSNSVCEPLTGEGGTSRTAQYLRYVISNIEELRMIKQYRTPAMMRHSCSILFHIFAVLLVGLSPRVSPLLSSVQRCDFITSGTLFHAFLR